MLVSCLPSSYCLCLQTLMCRMDEDEWGVVGREEGPIEIPALASSSQMGKWVITKSSQVSEDGNLAL